MNTLSFSLVLLACTGDPPAETGGAAVEETGASVETDETGETAEGQETADTAAGWAGASLSSPAEAEDLDPADGAVRFALTAAPLEYTIDAPEPITVDGYAYNGQVPGPTLRAQLGDTVTVELTNDLDDPTTIHWHGLNVPYEMDGVTWTSDPIAAGETFTYSFTVQQAGTFWYHPHFDTERQVTGGLYGALIVEDPADPVPDRELVLVIDDWSRSMEGDVDHHLEPEGVWTVNSLYQPTATLQGGEVVRARLINTASAGYLDLSWADIRRIAGDQGLLAALEEPESILLAPGDRVDVEWLAGEAGFSVMDRPYSHLGGEAWGDDAELMRVEIASPAAAPQGLGWAFAGGAPSEDPSYTDITWVFSGSPEADTWMINGEVFPEVSVPALSLGDEAVIEIRNLSPTEHPFHLHGLHFEVLSIDGEPPAIRTIEDTINVGIYGTARLKILADNPGSWMAHCHILPHAEGGMMTVLQVDED